MEILERIWEFLSGFFSGILRGFERTVTSVVGSSNERLLKKMYARIDAINVLESKYQAMSNEQLKEQTVAFRRRLSEGETLDDL